MSRSSHVEEALGRVASANEVASQLAMDLVVQQVLASVAKAKSYAVNVDALSDELEQMVSERALDAAMDLEGTDGLKEAVEARRVIQSDRDRLVAINRGLRTVLFHLQRVFKRTGSYLRTQELIRGMPVKAQDDLISVALADISDRLDEAKLLMAQVEEMMTNLDHKTRVVDAWFNVHKQYTFMTLSHNRGDDADGPPKATKRLGRRPNE